MKRTPTPDSANVVSIGYDPEQQLLEVEFPGRRLYQYEAVPLETAMQMAKAESLGRFLHTEVKPNFKCKKVDFIPAETAAEEKVSS